MSMKSVARHVYHWAQPSMQGECCLDIGFRPMFFAFDWAYFIWCGWWKKFRFTWLIMCNEYVYWVYWAKVITQLCFILIISLFLRMYSTNYFSQTMLNQSSIFPHNGLKNLFPTVQETNHFMEVGWLKKMKCMVMYQYPTCGMNFVHRNRWVHFWDFFRNSLHF